MHTKHIFSFLSQNWWRQSRRRQRKTLLIWRRRRRGAQVWELRLAIHQFSRRGAFILMLPFQLPIISNNCQLCPPLIFLQLPFFGFPHPPSQHSTHLHHTVWCLDPSGWFVAPVNHGDVSQCHDVMIYLLICVICVFWLTANILFFDTEPCSLDAIQS